MDVFDLRQQIVQDYANFARSFTRVRADDLKRQIDTIYAKTSSGLNRYFRSLPITSPARHSMNWLLR
jgi:hypothetical protein